MNIDHLYTVTPYGRRIGPHARLSSKSEWGLSRLSEYFNRQFFPRPLTKTGFKFKLVSNFYLWVSSLYAAYLLRVDTHGPTVLSKPSVGRRVEDLWKKMDESLSKLYALQDKYQDGDYVGPYSKGQDLL